MKADERISSIPDAILAGSGKPLEALADDGRIGVE